MDVELHLNCYYVRSTKPRTCIEVVTTKHVREWDMSTVLSFTYNKLNTVYIGSKQDYKDKKVLRIRVRDARYKIIIQSHFHGREHLTVVARHCPPRRL